MRAGVVLPRCGRIDLLPAIRGEIATGKELMEPIDAPAIETPATLEAFFKQNDHFQIYTHSVRTRLIVLALFTAYLLCFTYLTNRMRDYLLDLYEGQAAMTAMGSGTETHWLIYLLGGLTILVALLFFFYFFWAVVDVWGLQVHTSKRELRVQNTIMGQAFRRWTGVGSMLMEDVHEIKGAKLYTTVRSKRARVRFSPVDRLDQLIAEILANAKDARIVE